MRLFFSIGLLLTVVCSFSQIGIGTINPEQSSILDLNTTSKGLLPPRLSKAQRTVVVNPVAGLMIWCTNCGSSGEMQVFNGQVWTNISGTTASDVITNLASVATGNYSNVNSDSFLIAGSIVNDGGLSITENGFCWSATNAEPTVADTFVTAAISSSFSASITGLSPNTRYYVRSYAKNSLGTGYGSVLEVNTAVVAATSLATVVTGSASNVSGNSFLIAGSVTDTGGGTVTENGFCWSTTNAAPTIADTVVTAAISASFSALITGLSTETLHYIRSYAKNSLGTSYGSVISVSTTAVALSGVEQLLSASQFDVLFPYRADKGLDQAGPEFYSYQSLVDAVNQLSGIRIEILKRQNPDSSLIDYTYKLRRTDLATNSITDLAIGSDYDASWNIGKPEVVTSTVNFSEFLNSGNQANDKKELSGFLANISHETTGGGAVESTKTYGLYYKEEVGCSAGCAGYTAADTSFPAVAGKFYHGRGPIQLSWNYNYGPASFVIYGDKNVLLNAPETVLANGKNAFMTAILFWNLPAGSKPSCHQVIHTNRGFAKTINVINGGLECGEANSSHDPQVADRIGFYKRYMNVFGLTVTDTDLELSCRDMAPNNFAY